MKRADALPLAIALLCAALLKQHYASAGAEALAWILRPTAALVSLASGAEFVPERGVGFINREVSLVIAPACAGINYLVIAFLVLTLLVCARLPALRHKFALLPLCGLVAYAATLLGNATRISLSIALRRHWPADAALSFSAMHRIEGVIVYLGSLWLLCRGCDALFSRERRAARFGLLLPLVVYWSVTLLVPLLGGAAHNPQFFSHTAVVLATSLALFGASFALRRMTRTTAG